MFNRRRGEAHRDRLLHEHVLAVGEAELGVLASKALGGKKPDTTAEPLLRRGLPDIDLSWPGLRMLHLDPPVLVADDFFSADECDAYAALRDAPDGVHELAQSATFSGATSQARTSTTWFVSYQRVASITQQ